MKKILVAAIAVLIASPAFAGIQNVKVSGDIQSTFIDRQDFGLGSLYSATNAPTGQTLGTPAGLHSQDIFATQTRVRVDADLTDNVSATVRLLNERAWGTPASEAGGDGVDLDLAYVTLRSFLYSPLTLSVGRQEFIFGNGLIIGGGPNNVGVGHFNAVADDLTEIDSEDGIKAVLDYKPLTLTLFYYKEGQTLNSLRGLYDSNASSDDVFGYNVNYQLGDAYNTVLETYLFSRIEGDNYALQGPVVGGNPTAADKGDTLFVPGLRASTNPVKGLNVQGELAWQLGNHPVLDETGLSGGLPTYTNKQETEHREALAAQFLATYSLPVLEKYKPAVNASFTYVSGDKNGAQNYDGDAVKSAKVYSAWDQFDKNVNGGTIYNSIFPLSNLYIYTLGASAAPLEDVTTSFTWSSLWAANKFSAENPLEILQPNSDWTSSDVYLTPTSTNKKGLGNEYDVNLGYNYTEDVSFGVSLGWFVAGNAFADSNRGVASQAIADVRVLF
jgi:hypothetical protein